jgi:serine phosphatase RsbU (regulator of sigma subunit)
MISALLHAGIHLGEVFTELSGVLVQRSAALLATAAVAVVDISAQRLTFATAGHPSPLLRLPDGQVQRLDAANSAMIGIRSNGRGAAVSIPFPPGAQLVMFTDGLVERRDRPFYAGIDEAVSHLGAVGESLGPHQLVASLVDALLDDMENEDDVAVLVVENTS